jgi:hypothetical protein
LIKKTQTTKAQTTKAQTTKAQTTKAQTTNVQMANVQMAAQMTNVQKLCSEAHAQTPQALMDKAFLFPPVFQVTIAQHLAQVRFLRGAQKNGRRIQTRRKLANCASALTALVKTPTSAYHVVCSFQIFPGKQPTDTVSAEGCREEFERVVRKPQAKCRKAVLRMQDFPAAGSLYGWNAFELHEHFYHDGSEYPMEHGNPCSQAFRTLFGRYKCGRVTVEDARTVLRHHWMLWNLTVVQERTNNMLGALWSQANKVADGAASRCICI